MFFSNSKRKAFTMLELSMVVLVIGFIFTIIIKGKDVYEAFKVRSVEGQHNKISTAVNTYFTKYKRYPGDGCVSATPSGPSDCTGVVDGILNTANERVAFWELLINDTRMLTIADRTSIFGVDWNVANLAGETYLTFGDTGVQASADAAITCAVDKAMDDGINTTGYVRSTTQAYTAATDCWALTGNVTLQMNLRF